MALVVFGSSPPTPLRVYIVCKVGGGGVYGVIGGGGGLRVSDTYRKVTVTE
jgi:hypothetical protein